MRLALTIAGVGLCVLAATPASAAKQALPCASPAEQALVREFYTSQRPGAPLAIPGRHFHIPESMVASALPENQSVGTEATVAKVRKVWESINSWGAKTTVALVFTSGGGHAFNFPSLVPMLKPDTGENWIDAEADDGAGVHGHIYSPLVKAIYATIIPGKEPAHVTRAISFYDAEGKLVMGVYAQVNDKPFDQAAVDGFANTWELIKGMPRICR